MTPTRETLRGLSSWEVALWYTLVVASIMVFAAGVGLLVWKYRRGRRDASVEHLPRRLARAGSIVLSHRWIARGDGLAGLGHALVFYGFLVLFAGTATLAVQDHVAEPFFGYDFFRDGFYLGYSLVLDLFGAALLVGLLLMAGKRALAPLRLDYARADGAEPDRARERYVVGDWVFLGGLVFIGANGFVLEALRIAELDPPFERWSPAGWLVGQGLIDAGLGAAAATIHHALWWVHGLTSIAFVAAIPFTKAVHMLVAPANVALRDEHPGRRLPPLPADAKPEEVGYGRIGDLTWPHLLSLDACTKCGRCHVICPAHLGGFPLSPRDLVLDLRELAEGAIGIRSRLGIEPLHEPSAAIADGTVRPEALWSCTQCLACVEVCPVGIEHVPLINQLRRRLVEQGELDPLLQQTLESVYETGNSFGELRRKRARWAKELSFPVRDARKEPVEVLWFVGDYASFDPRNQRATRSLARLLDAAGVDFGILFDAERTGGCDVRRVGEEGLWTMLAEENVKTLSACEFDRILTSDPHTFHTLRNEYPQVGGEWPVLHHSQLLVELLEAGRLVPREPLRRLVTYHDPCTLGRYNLVFEEPRRVLAALGAELRELPRNRENSFCCGAGGGRIWMEDLAAPGSRRPSEQRVDEAVALGGIDYFVVACPKDVTMFEDAIKTSGHQGEIELRELSELVLEALQEPPGPDERRDAPPPPTDA